MKIRRRRSSCTGLSSAGSSLGVQQRRLGVAVVARGLAAQPIDRAVASGRDDPAGRRRRHAAVRPARDRRGERVLHGLLGDVDVAEDAGEDRHRPPVLLAKDTLDLRTR